MLIPWVNSNFHISDVNDIKQLAETIGETPKYVSTEKEVISFIWQTLRKYICCSCDLN